MSQQNRATLKGYYASGKFPTQGQYVDLIDSQLNLTDTTVNPQIVNTNISASGYISTEGSITASGNIKTSGNITASGIIAGNVFDSPVTGDGANGYRVGGANLFSYDVGTNRHLIGSSGTEMTLENNLSGGIDLNVSNLNIGTGSQETDKAGSGSLYVKHATDNCVAVFESGDSTAYIRFLDNLTNVGGNDRFIGVGAASNVMRFRSDTGGFQWMVDNEAMVGASLDNDGDLHVSGAISCSVITASIIKGTTALTSSKFQATEIVGTTSVVSNNFILSEGGITGSLISSSGDLYGNVIYVAQTNRILYANDDISFPDTGINVAGSITSSGNISASGNITASAISASDSIRTGTFTHSPTDTSADQTHYILFQVNGNNVTNITNGLSFNPSTDTFSLGGDKVVLSGALGNITGSGGLRIAGDEVDFTNLPTSDPEVTGRLWNDSGTVKISAG